MDENKKLIRVADRIREALVKLRNERLLELTNKLTSLMSGIKELSSDTTKLDKALRHRWYRAAEHIRTRIYRGVNDLSFTIDRAKQFANTSEEKAPDLAVLLADLRQLEQDWGQIDYDSGEETISIVTDPIELDDVYLGPFKIELDLDKLPGLYKDSPYHVIALEPNPAATDESVTHPHVSNEKVCEGDGSVTIRAALEQSRLCDFFTIVISILNTYNPDSPYVNLSDWDGSPCYDCGYTCDRENCYYCSYCDHEYCEECSSYCRLCNEIICVGCSSQCPHCEETVCSNCTSKCKECEELYCKECLDEGMCPNCIEERESKNEERENENTETEGHTNQGQPETAKSEIRLAS